MTKDIEYVVVLVREDGYEQIVKTFLDEDTAYLYIRDLNKRNKNMYYTVRKRELTFPE